MEKINIAELLKDCPTGMELDCTMFDNVTFVGVNTQREFPIEIKVDSNTKYLTKEGCYHRLDCIPSAKCVIFPKGKTTWEGFQRPFKDGDVVYIQSLYEYIVIYKKTNCKNLYKHAAICISFNNRLLQDNNILCYEGDVKKIRLATEEEKQKLFDAIKENGYKWNDEKKELEKLIEPKFKVGDRIRLKSKPNYICTIHSLTWDYNKKLAYRLLPDNDKHLIVVNLNKQDNYELAPNKFDITTLMPFESRVLVRSTNDDIWRPAIYGFTDSGKHYIVGGIYWKQCISYEVNKELLGTTDNCDDYYKTWK